MRGTAYATLGATIGIRLGGAEKKLGAAEKTLGAADKTRVVLVRHQSAVDEDLRADPAIVEAMLDDAVMALLDKNDPVEAFRHIVKPQDVVGIKSNQWRYMPTPPELVKSIERRVRDAGVAPENISIDDRGVRQNPVFQKATAIINTRPLRTHYSAGIGGCIKNLIMFDTDPSSYHPDSCADLGLVLKLPMVQGKLRLHVLSALTPLYHGRGAHHYDRRYIWGYKGILVSTDPVAVDAVGLELIRAKRLERFGVDRKMERAPHHVSLADVRHGLGVSDLSKIELIKLGWKDGILI
jgi:hypothetical protein